MKTLEQTTPEKANSNTNTKAWRLDMAAIKAKYPTETAQDCTVEAWIVEAPWSHPVWPRVEVAVIHLREAARVKPARIRLEGATHEIFVYAVHPEHEVDLEDRPVLLTPVNFVGQFIADSDEAAIERLRATVDMIVAGTLNPDTDALHQWVGLFGDHCMDKQDAQKTIQAIAAWMAGDGSKARELLGMELDAWGATAGCDCDGCKDIRREAGSTTGAPEEASPTVH